MRRVKMAMVVAVALCVAGYMFIGNLLIGQEQPKPQMQKDIATEITVPKGVWVFRADGPVTLKGSVKDICAYPEAAPGPSFFHADRPKGSQQKETCMGEIRQGIKNDGKMFLVCKRCGQEWEMKESANPKP